MIESPGSTQGGSTHNGVREFVRFLKRRKILILTPALLIAVVAVVIALITPPRYAAEAGLALDVRKVEIVDHQVVSSLPQESPALRTELDVIRSRSLAEQVVDRLGLAANPGVLREAGTPPSLWRDIARVFERAPRDATAGSTGASGLAPILTRSQVVNWLVANLKAVNDGRSLTIVVSFTSASPQRAAWIANAVAQNYLDDQVRTKARATVAARDWLADQLQTMRRDLENSETKVDDFRRRAGLIEVKGATISAQRLSDLDTQLGNAHLERVHAEARLQTARESDPQTLPDILASPLIQQLRKELDQINLRIAQIRVYSPFYKLTDLDAQAAVLRTQMKEEMNRIVASLSSDVMVARKREAELTQSFQDTENQLSDAARSGVRLAQLQREADVNRSIYETFLARYKQTMEQESLAAPEARIISRAEPPGAPVSPKKLQSLVLGMFGGLVVGGALAFVREGLDRRVHQASEVEAVTGIPVFGMLPRVSRWRRMQPQDYPVRDPRSRFCAALMRIHTALRPATPADRKQVILVTSAQPGDGKTSFCASLARSLAKSQRRVLVVDADPYRSQVGVAFGVMVAPALVPAKGQSMRLGDLVQADALSDAHFIPAPNEQDLQQLLHTGGFAVLLDEARQLYDIVIIDTPPVMTSADAALLGSLADIRLFLVRWGRTSWDEMTAAIGFLRLCRIALDGIVIVGADAGSTNYGQILGYDATAPGERRLLRPTAKRSLSEAE
ncbi:MAG: polysaccharide biosynthesis tyrosine autokinase [Stellaceae bacterium]